MQASARTQRATRSNGGSGTTRYAVRPGRAPNPRASSAKVRSRTSTSDPRITGPTSGTRARTRWRNDPVTGRPRACWAWRIEAARACIRGTVWTADRMTKAIRWPTPRLTSASRRSSASVVKRKVTVARNATRTRPADTSPNVRPSRVTESGPSVRSRSVAPGKNRALTTRIDVSRSAGMRIARTMGPRSPADHAMTTRPTAIAGRTTGGSRNAASRTSATPRSLVSG